MNSTQLIESAIEECLKFEPDNQRVVRLLQQALKVRAVLNDQETAYILDCMSLAFQTYQYNPTMQKAIAEKLNGVGKLGEHKHLLE